jgi:hypothetical protein
MLIFSRDDKAYRAGRRQDEGGFFLGFLLFTVANFFDIIVLTEVAS